MLTIKRSLVRTSCARAARSCAGHAACRQHKLYVRQHGQVCTHAWPPESPISPLKLGAWTEWKIPVVNEWIGRPQGFIVEIVLAMMLITIGFPVFWFAGSFAAIAFFTTMIVIGTTMAALTALTMVLPILIIAGGAGFFFATNFMKTRDGKELRSSYESIRTRMAPGSRKFRDIIDVEAEIVEEDTEVRSAYQDLDAELSEFDRELRRRTRR